MRAILGRRCRREETPRLLALMVSLSVGNGDVCDHIVCGSPRDRRGAGSRACSMRSKDNLENPDDDARVNAARKSETKRWPPGTTPWRPFSIVRSMCYCQWLSLTQHVVHRRWKAERSPPRRQSLRRHAGNGLASAARPPSTTEPAAMRLQWPIIDIAEDFRPRPDENPVT